MTGSRRTGDTRPGPAGLLSEGARPAAGRDLDRMAGLCRQAMAELAGVRGGDLHRLKVTPPRAVEEELAAALADPARTAWVGTIDSEVVGYGLGRRAVLPDGAALGVVDAIYVEPAARGVGVGEAIMEAMNGWFHAQGCRGVDAVALPGDRATKAFWEASGFKARLIVMHRPMAR
ncbi:MAG: GNAT family N-acetyltransferase [Acidimicrobiales bacterium]